MTSNGFQRALAEVLTSVTARAMLDERPGELAARFGLSAAELDALVATDREQLDIVVRSVSGKRLDMLARCLPATISALPHQHEVLDDFIRQCPPAHAEGQQNHKRVLAEGTRFLDYLVLSGRSQMADLARYEVLRLELLYDPAAVLAAERAAAASDGSTPGAHVRLAEFTSDVVSQYDTWVQTGSVPAAPQGIPIRIALVKLAGRTALGCYRLGEQAYRILCSGGPVAPEASAVLRFARQEGLLV